VLPRVFWISSQASAYSRSPIVEDFSSPTGEIRAQGLPRLVTRTFSPLPTRRRTLPVLFLSSLAVTDFMVSSYFNCIVAPCDYWLRKEKNGPIRPCCRSLRPTLPSPHYLWSAEKPDRPLGVVGRESFFFDRDRALIEISGCAIRLRSPFFPVERRVLRYVFILRFVFHKADSLGLANLDSDGFPLK